jgi:uncharacterized protein (TIGR02217 family)
MEYVLGFWNARLGDLRTFKAKNWMDYTCTSVPQPSCIDPEMKTQGVTYPPTAIGFNTTFHLCKEYKQQTGRPNYKRIYYPIESTLRVYADAVLVDSSQYQVLPNGIIQFNSLPTPGAVITHDCEFDLLVRFGSSQLSISLVSTENNENPLGYNGKNTYKIGSLQILECAFPGIPPRPQLPPGGGGGGGGEA